MKELTLRENQANHKKNHPTDLGLPREGRGITWSNLTERDKKLDEFYKTHIYTFVDENDLTKKRWVRISGNVVGEEE